MNLVGEKQATHGGAGGPGGRAVYCTYPVPLYAHTHFLAAVRAALVLDRVRAEALPAPPLLRALGVTQHFRHSLLVNDVKALRARRGTGVQPLALTLCSDFCALFFIEG